jgi:hypothetical protein
MHAPETDDCHKKIAAGAALFRPLPAALLTIIPTPAGMDVSISAW